ncbi:MAG TPA: type II 3-dehydroquinate dehydratase [Alphaproteobacteria bacterium]|jgi:3-dehydroquinate dehydratase II|nr:type II 3-dehydroquinate dehydratase [Micavibrio sp.]MBK9562195.1 type II 3-dehydroquinate dehydratase [Micavibrio sp.]HQX27263.1 type II 3-dehydroquinate dehydratase [Alphaproteobacteria bacterium]
MKKILILNGPNLNMLGTREPEIYGRATLDDIKTLCEQKAKSLGMAVDFRQSNHEGELVDWIQEAAKGKIFDGLIINAAAYTHTSIAIHDAVRLLSIPVIEVHLSNPKKREKFRRFSYVGLVTKHVIAGYKEKGYEMAIEKISSLLSH